MLEEGRSRRGRAALFVLSEYSYADAGGWFAWLRDAERRGDEQRAAPVRAAVAPAAAARRLRRPAGRPPTPRRAPRRRGGARGLAGTPDPRAKGGEGLVAPVRTRAPAAPALLAKPHAGSAASHRGQARARTGDAQGESGRTAGVLPANRARRPGARERPRRAQGHRGHLGTQRVMARGGARGHQPPRRADRRARRQPRTRRADARPPAAPERHAEPPARRRLRGHAKPPARRRLRGHAGLAGLRRPAGLGGAVRRRWQVRGCAAGAVANLPARPPGLLLVRGCQGLPGRRADEAMTGRRRGRGASDPGSPGPGRSKLRPVVPGIPRPAAR